MSLRVITGLAKGRKLKSVPGDTTRPITDRVKVALFDILSGELAGATWWDLFAGTGAVGIEALSRGASFVRFSDLYRAPIETIKWNLEHCRLATNADVKRGDAFAMLAARPDRQFDYFYIAPPQYKGMWSQALSWLDGNPGWLETNGLVIVQIHPRERQEIPLENLEALEERKYGNTLLVFYQVKEK